MEHTITTRKEAKACGLSSYFTGKPCKNGHVSLRTTSKGTCKACQKDWSNTKREDTDYVEQRRHQGREYAKNRWANDAEYRERSKQKRKEYHRDPIVRERHNKKQREKLASDVGFRERNKQRSLEWRRANSEYYKEYLKLYFKTPEGQAVKIRGRARYESRLILATPSWVDFGELGRIAAQTPEGYHVDHIIPLQGEMVCGLNVPWNLQYLIAFDNARKKNKFDGTYENDGWRKE